ncbi:DoxX family membrane protein [bacterium]|nr:DoxX family membrane protein [bacterium]
MSEESRDNTMMLKRFFYVSLLMFIVPTVTTAHTRWFAHEELLPYKASEPTGLYLGAWTIIVAATVGIGYWLERRGYLSLRFLQPRAVHSFDRAASAFTMMAGAFLMIAGTHGFLFSPNLAIDLGIAPLFVYLQFLIGLAFLLGIYARLAAILLAALWFIGIPVIGVIPMIEDVWILSTAAFVFIMGNDYFSLVSFRAVAPLAHTYRSYALPLLRLGTGATLFILGFTEKILHPEFGLNFLRQYDWNFMALAGLPYSDYLFTLSAGAVESLFGLIFILGIMTRLNALVVATIFSIPIFLLGPIELTGHLPHFAAIILILLFGAGNHFRLVQSAKRR